ncbi:MAG: XTP/dITP diphosphatase [Nitrospiria bacterium]
MVLVLATQNQDKVQEIKAILGESVVDMTLKTLADFPGLKLPPETGQTYRENALQKAIHVAKATGEMAMGDDSGLEVDALDGAPGLYSARFAGENATYADNRGKILQLLEGLPDEKRGARFVCTIAIARSQGSVDVVEGACDGRITATASGEGGFGYDPIFFYPPEAKTFSELTFEEKNRISHRACALRAAVHLINAVRAQKH